MKKIILGLLFFVLANSAYALTGNELYEQLTSQNSNEQMRAYAYIEGVLDTEVFYLGVEIFGQLGSIGDGPDKIKKWPVKHLCFPDGTINKQIFDLVSNYLRDHPENRAGQANTLIREAILSVWGCKGNPN